MNTIKKVMKETLGTFIYNIKSVTVSFMEIEPLIILAWNHFDIEFENMEMVSWMSYFYKDSTCIFRSKNPAGIRFNLIVLVSFF